MPIKFRVVFDVDVLVGALLIKNSIPRRALDKGRKSGEVLLSPEVVEELDDVLRRKKLRKYVSDDERLRFICGLLRESGLCEPGERVSESRDAKDDKYLELALEGGADFIVTGDTDLLVLNPFRGIQILTPRQFLELRTP